MNKFYDTLRGWRSAWHQPATYFGMAMIAAIWVSSTYHLAVERDRLELGAVKNSSNLARVFENQILGAIRASVDGEARLNPVGVAK